MQQAGRIHQVLLGRGRGRQQLIDHLPIDRMERMALIRHGVLRHGLGTP